MPALVANRHDELRRQLLIPALVSKPSSFAMPFWQSAVAVEL